MLRSLISGREIISPGEFVSDTARTICITGHREKNIPPYRDDPANSALTANTAKLMLCRYIDMAAERGYTDFISGLAMGTDLWAAEYIIKKKQKNGNIRLIGAMPFLRHAEYFTGDYVKLLREAEEAADVLVCVSAEPNITYSRSGAGHELYRDRNYFMVEQSSAVIAFLNRGASFSGTSQTVNYAYRRGRKICRFGIEDVYSLIDEAGMDIRAIGRELVFMDNVFDYLY